MNDPRTRGQVRRNESAKTVRRLSAELSALGRCGQIRLIHDFPSHPGWEDIEYVSVCPLTAGHEDRHETLWEVPRGDVPSTRD